MKGLVTAFVTLGSAAAVTALVGMLRVKWVAVHLGPEGVGLMSQLFSAAQLASGLACLGIGAGVIREVSALRSQGDGSGVRQVMRTALLLTLPGALLFTAGGLGLAPRVAAVLLGTAGHSNLVGIAALSVVPVAVASVLLSGLNGLGEYKWLARLNVGTAFAALLLLLPLVRYGGLAGAAVQLGIVGVLQLTAVMAVLKARLPAHQPSAMHKPGSTVRRALLSFGLLYMSVGLVQQGALLYVRSHLLAHMGEIPAGLFAAIWGISWTYLSLLVGAIQPYYLAELASARDDGRRSELTSDVMRLVSLTQTPVSIGILLLAGPILEILYSHQFAPAAGLLRLQATSNLLAVASWALFLPFVAKGRLASALVVESAFWLPFAVLSRRADDLPEVVLCLVASRVVQGFVAILMFSWYGGNRVSKRATISLLSGVTLVVTVFLRQQLGVFSTTLVVVVGIGWLLASIRPVEIRFGIRRLRSSVARITRSSG